MDELQASLPAFERQLLAHCYGLYSINYMQDFSGVLDLETLVEHLCTFAGFHKQGDLTAAMCKGTPTVLANTDSVGKYLCTWVRTSLAGYTVCTKLSNKVVSTSRWGITENLNDFNIEDLDNLEEKKTRLYELGKNTIEGVMLRSRCRYENLGEKAISYFFNLEKRNYTNKVIVKLIEENGKE
ncbi:MAG: hypothetical protein AB2556_25910 [Candidatus Thiodiazotropha sp.]